METHCRPCGKLDVHIDGWQHTLGTMHRWCVAVFSIGLWNIPIPVDQVLDGRVIQTHAKVDALCEQRWPSEQNPGKKSGHMLHLLCHQGPLGTVCLQQDSDHVCLWPGYHLHHDTAKHSYSSDVKESTGEWNGALLPSMIKLGSVCMRLMDVDLVSVTFRSAFAHDKRTHLRLHGVGAISYYSRSHLVFLQGKVNSARYIAQVLNPVLLPFLRQDSGVLFSKTTHVHIWLMRLNVFFVVYNICSG